MVTKLILDWFVGVIFGQETQNLNDPYMCIIHMYHFAWEIQRRRK